MKTTDRPQGCTNFKLRRVTRLISRHYDAHLAPSGLRTTQYSLLSTVLARGPIRPVDLAEAMELDASTLTRNLKPLIDAGWLTLGEGADARSRSIAITDAGRAKRVEARAMWQTAQRKINDLLGAGQVVALHALLDQTLAQLQQAAHESAQREPA